MCVCLSFLPQVCDEKEQLTSEFDKLKKRVASGSSSGGVASAGGEELTHLKAQNAALQKSLQGKKNIGKLLACLGGMIDLQTMCMYHIARKFCLFHPLLSCHGQNFSTHVRKLILRNVWVDGFQQSFCPTKLFGCIVLCIAK